MSGASQNYSHPLSLHLLKNMSVLHLFHRCSDSILQGVTTFPIVLFLRPQTQLHPGLKLSVSTTYCSKKILGIKDCPNPNSYKSNFTQTSSSQKYCGVEHFFPARDKISVRSFKDQRLQQSNSEHSGHNYEILPLLPTKS